MNKTRKQAFFKAPIKSPHLFHLRQMLKLKICLHRSFGLNEPDNNDRSEPIIMTTKYETRQFKWCYRPNK